MKRIVMLFAVVGLMAFGSGVQDASAQNLLSNGGVDLPGGGLPITDWTKDESKTFSGPTTDLSTLEPWADQTAPVGFGIFFKAFQGNETTGDLATAHIYQDVPGTAGTEYVLSGWAGAESGYSGLLPGTATQSILGLEFDNDNDFGNGNLGEVILDLAANGLGSGPGASFGYDQFSVTGVAPAGTTVVRARISMIDGFDNSGGQAFVADDFSLTVGIPEPSSIALFGLALTGLFGFCRRSK